MKFEEFINNITLEIPFEFYDENNLWQFGKPVIKSIRNRKYRVIAVTAEGLEAALDSTAAADKGIVWICEEGGVSFFTLSLKEWFHRKELLKIHQKIIRSMLLKYNEYFDKYADCHGCLYWIASGILSRLYDGKKHDADATLMALDLLKQIADKEDPRACSDLASYYVLEDSNSGLEFKYKKMAIINGSFLDRRKLAEFIIDEKQDEIPFALSILKDLRDENECVDWSYWQEANIYLKGLNVEKDQAKGILLLQEAVKLGHPVAIADYSYFLYNGIGIDQDKIKGIEYLEKANKLMNGRFTEHIKKLKTQTIS